MSIDLEGDLRREFDAARPPNNLTFSAESVLRQGSRITRRRRMVAAGSAAMAVGLVAVGATVMNRPHDTPAPQPATHTATTGIVRAETSAMNWGGSPLVEFNRDPRVELNVKFSIRAEDGRLHEVGRSSAGKPGQKADATWRSAVVDGHPVIIGLLPGDPTEISVKGGTYEGLTQSVVEGTGYTMFYITYPAVPPDRKTPARPAELSSIRWTGPNGIVDGIEGDRRLSGRALHLSDRLSVEVVLRPGAGGRTTVSGATRMRERGVGFGWDLSDTTVDPSGVAVVTGRQPIARRIVSAGVDGNEMLEGAPIAAGILPPGAAKIGVILTKGEALNPVVVLERLPDGRVIFAVMAESAHPSVPSKDSIKTVTWTNADGSQGRKDATQHKR